MDLFSSKAKCAGCGKKIESKEPSVDAMKKKFHEKCFVCFHCKKPIRGEFHPVDDQPWDEACFLNHKAPKCAECRLPIANRRVKTDDGRIFHEACLATASQGNCARCKQPIRLTEQVTEALDQTFHVACFVCKQCGGELPAEFHVDERDNKPLCNNCHNQNRKMSDTEAYDETVTVQETSDDQDGRRGSNTETETLVRGSNEVHQDDRRGSGTEMTDTVVRGSDQVDGGHDGVSHRGAHTEIINRSFSGADLGNVNEMFVRSGSQTDLNGEQRVEQHHYVDRDGNGWFGMPTYRPTNLREVDDGHCSVCVSPITSGTRVEARGKNFHDDCFNQVYSGECGGCNRKIMLTEPSVTVKSLARDWHQDCLNCGACKTNITGEFRLQNGAPTCDSCYVSKFAPHCAGCNEPVNDPQLKALQAVWHPDCFNCDVCHEALYKNGTEFFNVGGKPYCHRDIEAAQIKVM